MSHIMSRINIPIRLQFLRTPATWELREVENKVLELRGGRKHWITQIQEFAFPTVRDADEVVALDAWKCRELFFSIPDGDNAALLRFLKKTGVYMGGIQYEGHRIKELTEHHCRKNQPAPIPLEGLWRFRKHLKSLLLDKKEFKKTYAMPVSQTVDEMQFPLSLELTSVATGVVTLTDTYRALLATVFFDVTRGVKFKVCARKDCGRPFPLTSRHKRKFCGHSCAHTVVMRKIRKKNGPQKLAR